MKLDLLREASSFVDQCLTAEPTFARAHVLRSSTRLTNWRFGSVLIFAGFPERAIEVGRAHLRVDPFALPLNDKELGKACEVM